MKKIAVLGSTGSIGVSALDVIRKHAFKFRVTALSAKSNARLLLRQALEFKPDFIHVQDKAAAEFLKNRLRRKTKVFSGEDSLPEMLRNRIADEYVMAISGSAALTPLLKIIDTGADIALANKEALVMAGPVITRRVKLKKARILPIDSEASAIWQCLLSAQERRLKQVYLTASGGPFRKLGKNAFKHISIKDALRHPRWKMGRKISVDSATLMNKGLELIEAMYLFGIPARKIKILVHPESIIHSMVEFSDGAVMAQLSATDMRIPIQYALSYPQSLESPVPELDFLRLKKLTFEPLKVDKFPCLGLAQEAASLGGSMPAVLNAANEAAVTAFLKQRIDFNGIPKVIEKVLRRHDHKTNPDLSDILEADSWARLQAERVINNV